MLVAIALHAVGAALVLVLVRRLGRWVFAVAGLVPAGTLAWALSHASEVAHGGTHTEILSWAPAIGLTGALRLDALGLLMILLVSGVGALVLAYYAYYVGSAERGIGRTAATLSVFAGAMLGLVLADDVFTLYVFWELTTVCSFLLVGGDGSGDTERRASVQALLVTAFGGLTMLLGLVLLAEAANTYRISEIVADPPSGTVVQVALVLVLVGAFTKSAQVPFHPWLPGAMIAPTPVSAYLHAAAMVKAGVYLVARFAPGFGDLAAWWVPVVLIGLCTMVLGGYRALRETDLKTLLAFGTVSQLGMLTVLVGAGGRVAALAGLTMLLAHGLFKVTLFLAVGVLDHHAGTRDIRELSGVGRARPVLAALCVLAVLSMAGVPPLLGFVGKEAAFKAFAHGTTVDLVVLAGLLIGSILTVGYSIRFVWGAFAGKRDVPDIPASRAEVGLVLPLAVPAVCGLVFGLTLSPVAGLVEAYVAGFGAGHVPYELALWHGFNLPLLLSAVALAGGYLAFRADRLVSRGRGRLPGVLHAQRGYERAVTGLDDLAHGVTARLQVGSLPTYLGVILVTVVVVSGSGLLAELRLPEQWRAWDNVLQVPLALLVLLAAGAVILARRRITAVLLTGLIGYGIAGLFIVDGGPDLALTQFLVESLTLVVFVFVLRRFPAHFTEAKPVRSHRWVKTVISAAAGIFVAGAAVLYSGLRQHPPAASQEYATRAVPETGASNVVNAILVDFRALDTIGEITVLMVAITGAASLILAANRSRRPAKSTVDETRQVTAAAQDEEAP